MLANFLFEIVSKDSNGTKRPVIFFAEIDSTGPWCQDRCLRTQLCGVVDAGFNSWLAPVARSAKTDACGRSFAVVSTQVSTVGLRLGWRLAANLT
jgi:hypothetical protein